MSKSEPRTPIPQINFERFPLPTSTRSQSDPRSPRPPKASQPNSSISTLRQTLKIYSAKRAAGDTSRMLRCVSLDGSPPYGPPDTSSAFATRMLKHQSHERCSGDYGVPTGTLRATFADVEQLSPDWVAMARRIWPELLLVKLANVAHTQESPEVRSREKCSGMCLSKLGACVWRPARWRVIRRVIVRSFLHAAGCAPWALTFDAAANPI